MNWRVVLEDTYREVLEAVAPARLLAPHLGGPRPDLVVAFGKAALPPRDSADLTAPSGAEVYPASHPVPGEDSVRAAEAPCSRPPGGSC